MLVNDEDGLADDDSRGGRLVRTGRGAVLYRPLFVRGEHSFPTSQQCGSSGYKADQQSPALHNRLVSSWSGTSSSEPFVHLDNSLPETRWVTGVAGFSESPPPSLLSRTIYLSSEGELTGCTDYFTNLYSRNGVFIVVTSDPTHLPRQGPGYIMSGPVAEDNDVPAAEEDRWMVLNPEMALHVLGGVAVRKGGTSVSLSLSLDWKVRR